MLQITRLLAQRHDNIKRSVGNFRKLTEAVAGKDQDLAQLIDASNAVFQAFTNQDRALRSALNQLPGTLNVAQTNLAKANKLANVLGPTLQDLRPAARALGPTLKQMRPFLEETTPIIQNQIRPFARASLPTVKILRPAAQNLAKLTPDLVSTFQVLNTLVNELAYNPPGDAEEGYLFWAAWTNHAGNSIFGAQDGMGAIRRGAVLASCSTLQTLPNLIRANPRLGQLVSLLNPVNPSAVCPTPASAGTTPPSTTGTGRRAPPRRRPRPPRGRPADAEAGPDPRPAVRDGGVRAVVLRPAAVPVAGLRRPDAAGAQGVPLQDLLRRGHPAGQGGRRAHLRRLGRQGQGHHHDAGRPLGDHHRARLQVRADPQGRARDPAPEDAAGGDLRRADARLTSSGMLPENGTLPASQVSPTVELDEILSTFDAKTRAAFQTWLQGQAAGIQGQGKNINSALGNLAPFAIDTNTLLRILKAQGGDVRGIVSGTGDVFDALTPATTSSPR